MDPVFCCRAAPLSVVRVSSAHICKRCTKQVKCDSDSVIAEGFHFHVPCFVCDVCGERIGSSYSAAEDGRILCEGGTLQSVVTCTSCAAQIEGVYYGDGAGAKVCEACRREALPECGRCCERINGDAVFAEDRPFHAECFFCDACDGPIKGEYFVGAQDSNRIICEQCASNAVVRCAVCGQPVDGTYFTSETCKDRPVCEPCMRLQLPTCVRCGLQVEGECMVFNDQNFHPECFRCKACDLAIVGDCFPDTEGQTLCERCAEELAQTCACCKEPIWGEGTAVEDVAYHKECFTCSSCFLAIGGEYSVSEGGFRCQACTPTLRAIVGGA